MNDMSDLKTEILFEKAKAAAKAGGRAHGIKAPKLEAVSMARWRATAAQKRLYGGSTVTEFWVSVKGDPNRAANTVVVKGYGKTPGERKTDALRKGEKLLRDKGIINGSPGSSHGVHALELDRLRWKDQPPLSAPWLGPRIKIKGDRPIDQIASVSRQRAKIILEEAGLHVPPPRPGRIMTVVAGTKSGGMWSPAKEPRIEIENKAGRFVVTKNWYF